MNWNANGVELLYGGHGSINISSRFIYSISQTFAIFNSLLTPKHARPRFGCSGTEILEVF